MQQKSDRGAGGGGEKEIRGEREREREGEVCRCLWCLRAGGRGCAIWDCGREGEREGGRGVRNSVLVCSFVRVCDRICRDRLQADTDGGGVGEEGGGGGGGLGTSSGGGGASRGEDIG